MRSIQTTLLDWLGLNGMSAKHPIVISDDEEDVDDATEDGNQGAEMNVANRMAIMGCDEDRRQHISPAVQWPATITRLQQNTNPNCVKFSDINFGKCYCSSRCVKNVCVNVDSAVYCRSNTCNAGPKCGNRLIECESLSLMQCSKGYGVVTTTYIASGTILGEYCGTIVKNSALTLEQVTRGHVLMFKSRSDGCEQVFVDASMGGSMCRFVNHSCKPNSRLEERSNRTRRRLVIVTHKDLSPGTEVTVKYSKHVTFHCLCMESNCVSNH